MALQTENFLLTLEIWDNGDYIATHSLENLDVSLYFYSSDYFLISYRSMDILNVEKISRETAKKLYPECILAK